MAQQSAQTSVCLQTWKTDLWLSVRTPPTARLRQWLTSLLHDEVGELDQLASRFRSDSQLSSINRNAGRWTDVSWEFVTVLSSCLHAATATDGLVDPLLGGQLVAAGYDQWAGQDSGVGATLRAHSWREIGIRPGVSAAQVRIPAGSALDLGAVAKGWLADRLARVTNSSTGFDVVANMGGDMRVISPDRPWAVAADPELPGIDACAMEVTDAGLATSGTGHRAWTGGHHIIDPRTGLPADTCWASVSVLAAEAAGANAAATAGLVLSAEGPGRLAGMGLDAWFVSRPDDGDPPTQRQVGAWPATPRESLARA